MNAQQPFTCWAKNPNKKLHKYAKSFVKCAENIFVYVDKQVILAFYVFILHGTLVHVKILWTFR